MLAARKLIAPGELLSGKVSLRLTTTADCTERYVAWLNDPEVSRYLDTRWYTQDLAAITAFVDAMTNDPYNYLFAIIDPGGGHVGNIKLGPVHPHHLYSEVSYFIGERSAWGKGYATEAIRLVTGFAFEILQLHRTQAGVSRSNAASSRALERCGYREEGCFVEANLGRDGFEDVLRYGHLRSRWAAR